MSKGSNPRPFEVPRKQYEDNWEKTFGKKQKDQQDKKQK